MKTQAYSFMIAGAAILWGLISIFFKLLSAAGLDGFQTVVVRFGFSAILLFVWLAVRSPQLLRIRRPAHLLYFIGAGILSQAFSIFVIIAPLRAQAYPLPRCCCTPPRRLSLCFPVCDSAKRSPGASWPRWR